VAQLRDLQQSSGTLLHINVPGGAPAGVEVARLGKRVYRDELSLLGTDDGGRRQYRIYGEADYERDEVGTDLAAVARGKIAVTPLHFGLPYRGELGGTGTP